MGSLMLKNDLTFIEYKNTQLQNYTVAKILSDSLSTSYPSSRLICGKW
jgi:hypothetical protein